MTKETFSRYDRANYLKTEEDIAAYMEAVMEGGRATIRRSSPRPWVPWRGRAT